ncbi:hypothetical protein BT96DRAFT_974691 [Gymnopus androsaceus JB14]|uniref:DNA polymerase epsilon subunit D n=1 Tax=Gymnopus androsaceus JB14 TaxID=1447944 RepID=A0A6A4HWI8_9AGAR|nr:hypothetical protein BT96DRAFT_974691 [Gymnopus androsaceus JB14]
MPSNGMIINNLRGRSVEYMVVAGGKRMGSWGAYVPQHRLPITEIIKAREVQGTPTLIPREPLFPRLLPAPPQTHVLPLPKANPADPPGSYANLNAWRNLQREMDDLSEEESELEELSMTISQRGFSFLVPIGKTLTVAEEKNDAEEDEEEEEDSDSTSAASGGPPSGIEDDGENESTQDLDASMEDLDEDGQNSDDDEMDEGDTEELEDSFTYASALTWTITHSRADASQRKPGPLSAQQQQDLVSEGIDNFELPKSLVTKIAKSAVPDNTKLQKEAILSLVKGSTVFINYLAATAHDVAQSKQHKSISASDVLKALELIQLGDLVGPLTDELQVYREQGKNDKGGGSAAAARRASTASTSAHQGQGQGAGTSIVNGKPTTSVSSNSKNKGKEREMVGSIANTPAPATMRTTETLPPPFTSAPLAQSFATATGEDLATAESLTAAINRAADADEDLMEVDDAVVEVERGDDVNADEEEEPDEAEQDEQEEELQDIVAMETQELHEDARSVEQRGARAEYKA